MQERIEYDAYGNPKHHRLGDINGDRAVNGLDTTALLADWGAIDTGGYSADSDLNRDGTVNVLDLLIDNGNYGAAEPEGVLSHASIANTVGFSGYLYTGPTQTYCVRMRWFDTRLGRWLERDPLGYADSMNLYQYGTGTPIGALDPFGLDEGGGDWEEEMPWWHTPLKWLSPAYHLYTIWDPDPYKHSWIEDVVDGGTAFADSWTWGITKKLRDLMGGFEGGVRYHRTVYEAIWWIDEGTAVDAGTHGALTLADHRAVYDAIQPAEENLAALRQDLFALGYDGNGRLFLFYNQTPTSMPPMFWRYGRVNGKFWRPLFWRESDYERFVKRFELWFPRSMNSTAPQSLHEMHPDIVWERYQCFVSAHRAVAEVYGKLSFDHVSEFFDGVDPDVGARLGSSVPYPDLHTVFLKGLSSFAHALPTTSLPEPRKKSPAKSVAGTLGQGRSGAG